MRTSEKPSLQSTLIELLGQRPSQTVRELGTGITRSYRRCSVQAIYKELRKLEASGVVLKVADRYSLNISWVLNGLRTLDTIYDNYLDSESEDLYLPAEGEKRRWTFTDLRRLDDFWIQIMIAMYHGSQSKSMLNWLTHPWFLLVHKEKEERFIEVQEAMGTHMYVICGGRTKLDYNLAEVWNGVDIYTFSYAESPYEEMRDTYFNVCENFILTIQFNEELTQELEALFLSVERYEHLAADNIMDIFNKRTRIRVQLEHNPKKAKRHHRNFSEFFGKAV